MQTLPLCYAAPHVEDLFSSTLAFFGDWVGGGRGFKKISFKSMNSSKDEKWPQVVAVVVVVVVANADAVAVVVVPRCQFANGSGAAIVQKPS